MADQLPVKILLLNAIETAIKTIAGIKQVFINPMRPIEESAALPYSNIFDDFHGSETVHKTDLYSNHEFKLSIHTWLKDDDSKNLTIQCEVLRAAINTVLLSRGSLPRQYCYYIEETDFDRQFYDNGYGAFIQNFDVKYKHEYANSYNLNPM